MTDMTQYESEIERMAEHMNESTSLSWFWAFMFGPLWFLYIGSYRWALIALALCFLVIGIVVNPFLAYAAHRSVARQKAEEAYQRGVRMEGQE